MRNTDAIYAWATPSSKGTTTYETSLWPDGTMSCDCPGWTQWFGKKKLKPRTCKHCIEHEDQGKRFHGMYKKGMKIPDWRSNKPAAIPVNTAVAAMLKSNGGSRVILADEDDE